MSRLSRQRTVPAILLVLLTGALVAAAPAARYEVSDEIVFDRRTNLHWQRIDDGVLRTHAQAVEFCAGAAFEQRAGWRLPTVMELQTLIDVRASSPAVDTEIFPGTRAELYWSSTAFAKDDTKVWWVSADSGVANLALRSETMYVRCVR